MRTIVASAAVIAFGLILIAIIPAFTTVTETQLFENVTTTSTPSVTVNLKDTVYKESLSSIVSVASNNVLDKPEVTALATDGRTATVTGLALDDTRNLTLKYKVTNPLFSDQEMLLTLFKWMPILFVIVGVFGILFGVYQTATRRG